MKMHTSHPRPPAQRTASAGQPQSSVANEPATASSHTNAPASVDVLPNGPAAAAILAAGIGCFAVGLFALAGDAFRSIAHFFTFYKPTGPLSGVTTSAIVVWLLSWAVLSRQWRAKAVALGRVTAIAFVLLTFGILLTFPPFMDLLQGK
ncbi:MULTISPECIES: hypothetical protein [Burkholderia]|uniref:Uncharacterized protein n=1 Tax=Burkholderia mayonis TaxID=1385591 RepID=A0A1B4FKQ6_9BURK|nr:MULTISPECIES: hypothetical protein [Burkholderia]AOJ04255.1 hypothetical protein WS70_20570 [Burkholderia mayonis]KVE43744.1 hypothetical protein WS70_08835 [Burkholderia mayonis]KVE43844.1 hypothetical protein WS69_21450 [Burkholderia sp. BDU5]